MDQLSVLQAIRLKGRVSSADLATTLGQDQATLATEIEKFVETGMLVEGKTLRLSPAGRDALNRLLAAERRDINHAAISAAYNDFRGVNAEFKSLVTDWQLKGGEPNDHEDAEYDAAVLMRLDRVHHSVLPIVGTASRQVPRLTTYADKLSAALQKIKTGDRTWFARPTIDSYHTVWFELHEELILAAGLTREEEAKAGDVL
jgi:hypothetical protein